MIDTKNMHISRSNDRQISYFSVVFYYDIVPKCRDSVRGNLVIDFWGNSVIDFWGFLVIDTKNLHVLTLFRLNNLLFYGILVRYNTKYVEILAGEIWSLTFWEIR